eukprot:6174464-Pleurochrysis_carterae.AAC.1
MYAMPASADYILPPFSREYKPTWQMHFDCRDTSSNLGAREAFLYLGRKLEALGPHSVAALCKMYP